MMLHPLFVAGLLEGFEGTLDEVVELVENPELNAQVGALRSHVAALRMRIEACLDQEVDGRVGASPDVLERKEALSL